MTEAEMQAEITTLRRARDQLARDLIAVDQTWRAHCAEFAGGEMPEDEDRAVIEQCIRNAKDTLGEAAA